MSSNICGPGIVPQSKSPQCIKHHTEMMFIYLGGGKFDWWCDDCLQEDQEQFLNKESE